MWRLIVCLGSNPKQEGAMPSTSALLPDVEAQTSGSTCSCEAYIPVKSKPETGCPAAKPTEAKLGDALLERHRIRSGSRFADALGTLLLHAVLIGPPCFYLYGIPMLWISRTTLVHCSWGPHRRLLRHRLPLQLCRPTRQRGGICSRVENC